MEITKKKALVGQELLDMFAEHGTPYCLAVANKVKELRKEKIWENDEMLNKLILGLAEQGYLTV